MVVQVQFPTCRHGDVYRLLVKLLVVASILTAACANGQANACHQSIVMRLSVECNEGIQCNLITMLHTC